MPCIHGHSPNRCLIILKIRFTYFCPDYMFQWKLLLITQIRINSHISIFSQGAVDGKNHGKNTLLGLLFFLPTLLHPLSFFSACLLPLFCLVSVFGIPFRKVLGQYSCKSSSFWLELVFFTMWTMWILLKRSAIQIISKINIVHSFTVMARWFYCPRFWLMHFSYSKN